MRYYSSSPLAVEDVVTTGGSLLTAIETLEAAGLEVRDVVVLVDSITRMGRAFNLKGSGSGKTMSGGVEAGALEIPRRFFGLASDFLLLRPPPAGFVLLSVILFLIRKQQTARGDGTSYRYPRFLILCD